FHFFSFRIVLVPNPIRKLPELSSSYVPLHSSQIIFPYLLVIGLSGNMDSYHILCGRPTYLLPWKL
ncbi:hypothetical protein L9F63_005343, partial [Diploptera punctata]